MSLNVEEVVIEDWGRLQIVINGVDVTIWRGHPTLVHSFSYREPFSDVQASIEFPGITPFESEADYPFRQFYDIEINQLDKEGRFVKNLFEGIVSSYNDNFGGSNSSMTVDCIGAMYQADMMLKVPSFNDYTFDIANGIQQELNNRIENYGLRLKKLPLNSYTNIGSRSRGSWNSLLTGWIQDLLNNAYTDGFMLKGEEACAIAFVDRERPGYWALGNYGTNLTLGAYVPFYGSSSYLTYYTANLNNNTEMYMRDLAARPQMDGFWVMDRRGKVFCYGNAEHHGDLFSAWAGARNAWAIAPTSTGEGYWICDRLGKVWAFGDAVHYGDQPSLPPVYGRADAVIDMSPMPNDDGYRLLTRCGKVHCYGSATYHGDDVALTSFYVGIATTPSGDGYWFVNTLGRVKHKGDAVHYGETNSPDQWIVDIAAMPDGEGYALLRDDGAMYYFGSAPDEGTFEWNIFAEHGAEIHQWTLLKDPGRQPRFQVKNMWDRHWHVTAGQPGVEIDLTRDYGWAPNVYYGEGVDTDTNCRWRNSKYPNIHPDPAPLWPGYNFGVNLNPSAAGVRQWEQAMRDRNWPIVVDGNFTWDDNYWTRRFQQSAGLIVDGIVGPATWNATFQVGEGSGDATGAYIAPLAETMWVEPFLYGANGSIIGSNPNHLPEMVRIERYDNFGEHMTYVEAMISSQARLRRDSGPNFYGTITLRTDPEEGHRFDIREGQNIVVKGYKGIDMFLHISEVNVNIDDLSVSLTVDTNARDAMTIAGLIARDRETNDPGRKRTRYNAAAKETEDRIAVWDCLAKGTLVQTADGPKKIEDVEVDELVWTYTEGVSALKPVQRAEYRGDRQVFKVRTGHRSIEATANHLFLTERNGELLWLPTEDLKKKDRIVTSTSTNGEIEDYIDPEEAWFLGVMTGDGNLSTKNVVNVCVFDHLRSEVVDVAKRLYGLDPRAIDDKHGVNFYSSSLWKCLKGLGLDKRSTERRIPTLIWKASPDAKRSYLDGYLQADAHRSKAHYSVAAANEALVEELRSLSMSIGLSVTNIHKEERKKEIYIKGIKVNEPKPLYRFNIREGKSVGEFELEGTKEFGLETIWSIDPGETVPTYDLQVADSHNFVANGLVVHNCENGGGVVPRHAVYANQWQVVRIPTGEFGQVVQTYFKTDPASEFIVAIFDRPVTQSWLQSLGDPTNNADYWKTFGDGELTGLVIAWGGGTSDEMCGYYPGRKADGDGITGVMLDRSSWNFWTYQPPWMWVAVYSTTTTFIEGRLYPGMELPGRVPDITGLPALIPGGG